jgi:Zn-finger nucleic acid-binding protein
MAAETLSCPMCGAPASTETTRCEHCGARLATVACPSCFGMMFLGAKFCSHCGARADRADLSPTKPELCPRCQCTMQAELIGATAVQECPRCEGLWVDTASLEQICSDREKRAAVVGAGNPVPPTGEVVMEEKVRYLPCPVCHKLMNRVNFAHYSKVVVDVCRGHGTWFDRDELRRIVEFIRTGGLEAARAREVAELEARKLQLEAAPSSGCTWDPASNSGGARDPGWESGVALVGSLLKSLLRC